MSTLGLNKEILQITKPFFKTYFTVVYDQPYHIKNC